MIVRHSDVATIVPVSTAFLNIHGIRLLVIFSPPPGMSSDVTPPTGVSARSGFGPKFSCWNLPFSVLHFRMASNSGRNFPLTESYPRPQNEVKNVDRRAWLPCSEWERAFPLCHGCRDSMAKSSWNGGNDERAGNPLTKIGVYAGESIDRKAAGSAPPRHILSARSPPTYRIPRCRFPRLVER
jgi:hypothetical protein